MSDPYKILNISPSASDEEVKHAYRELARKYHPDNYHDNPLADLAQEKMKEINDAYERIQKQRKGGSFGASSGSQRSGYDRRDAETYAGSPELRQARLAINRGDITQAERILNAAAEHGAEWHFLMGVVASRRGWMDDAKRHLETACRMDPTNEEYRNAMGMFADSGYHPEDYRGFRTINYRNDDCMRLCAAWSCCVLSGGRCCIC